MPNLVAAGLAALLQQPCHTPRGNTLKCSALEFTIPTAANSQLSAPAQTHNVPGTECSWHTVVLSPLHFTKLPGGEGQLPSVPSTRAWALHSPGSSTRGCALSPSAGQATLSTAQDGQTAADQQAALTGLCPPWRNREQL